LCVEPHNVEAIAEAQYKALTDQEYRQRCRAMAAVVKQRFAAQTMIERTTGVYEQAAALHNPRLRSRRISFV
jgi:glycosyltransferase involved in cell wall biosynthesis